MTREALEHALHKGYLEKRQMTAALLDVDFFSNLNAKVGGVQGDLILERIGIFLAGVGEASAARWGGDEFLLLFWDRKPKELCCRLEDIRKMWRHTRFVSTYPYEKHRLTFSMGVAGSHKASGPFELLKYAEIALFEAKKMGRNRIVYAEQSPLVILGGAGACTTAAGKALKGLAREGEEAFGAAVAEPYGVAVDRDHSLLFADRSNHRIVRIANGRMYTAAGRIPPDGICGSSQDRQCTDPREISLCKPSGVCVDGDGNMYIADTGHHRILKVRKGHAEVYAGCGSCGYEGDGSDARAAKLNRPGGVAVDLCGNVYTNDYGNNVIRRIDGRGIIGTVAGSGAYGFGGDGGDARLAALDRPYGLCVNCDGSVLYIADYGNHRIRRVELFCGGKITTVCGCGRAGFGGDGGRGEDACLKGPYWVCLDDAEEWLYIADALNHSIRRWHVRTNVIETVAGSGRAGYVDCREDPKKAAFHIPAGVAVDGRRLYVADYANNALRQVVLP